MFKTVEYDETAEYIECETCGETENGFFNAECEPVRKPRAAVYGIEWSDWMKMGQDERTAHLLANSSLATLFA